MYEIRLHFVSLHELTVFEAMQRRGVFALWGPQSLAPLLLSYGDLIEHLADPANRKGNRVTGYFATVEGNRRNAGRDAAVASGLLNHILHRLKRPATRGREAGSVDAVREVVGGKAAFRVVVSGRDPLKRPSTSRALRNSRFIEVDSAALRRHGEDWLNHDWR